jgi:hypothetical protein
MPIRGVAVPFTGHQTVHVLAGTKMFAEVLDLARKGDIAGLFAKLRARKKTHHVYLRAMASAAWRHGHTSWAEALAARAEAAGLPKADLLCARAQAFLAAGRLALAEADVRAALQLPDGHAYRRADLWQMFVALLQGSGRKAPAASALDQALSEFSGRPDLLARFAALRAR